MLAKKGAGIGGIASGRAEGWMEEDFTYPKTDEAQARRAAIFAFL
jgi:hypothetical protein